MTDHKQQAQETQKELKGGIIKNGDVVKLTNEKYRVAADITVAKGAVLVLNNAELYFAENAGIIVMGTLRAANSVFGAIDPEKGWKVRHLVKEKTIEQTLQVLFRKRRTARSWFPT